jgi:hypothetical protein
MSFRRRVCATVLVLFCAFQAASQVQHDTLTLGNGGTDENGVIVWGSTVFPKVPTTTSIDLGNIDRGEANQVVAFTKGYPPALNDNVGWTNGSNAVTIDYPAPYQVPIQFWVLCANAKCDTLTDEMKLKLDKFLVWANERLTAERVGFTLVAAGADWISDQTGPSGNSFGFWMNFNDCRCGDADDHLEFDDRVQGMKKPGAINIYIVKTVEDGDGKISPGNGWQCSWSYDSAVVGRNASKGTILHEIGHVFSLVHSDDWPENVGGEKNVMHSASSKRRSFTEGEVFRMHFSIDSAFNHDLSGVLSTAPSPTRRSRNCRRQDPALPCPEEYETLWSDK